MSRKSSCHWRWWFSASWIRRYRFKHQKRELNGTQMGQQSETRQRQGWRHDLRHREPRTNGSLIYLGWFVHRKSICRQNSEIFSVYYGGHEKQQQEFLHRYLPRYCRWTRIWCIRPVSGLHRTTLEWPLKPIFWKVVVQSFPFEDTLQTPIL